MDRRGIITAKTRRTCRVLKWVGALVCLLIVAVAIQDFSLMIGGGVGVDVWDVALYLVAFCVVLALTIYVWRLARPWPRGHCQVCGYNLTGNVSGVCPECGTPVQIQEHVHAQEPVQIQGQPDLAWASSSQCGECGCDLTGRFTGHCPDCGAETPRFPPGHCPMCGCSLVEETDEIPYPVGPQAAADGRDAFFCIFCNRFLPRRYPRGYCEVCGYNLAGVKRGRCPECGASVSGDA